MFPFVLALSRLRFICNLECVKNNWIKYMLTWTNKKNFLKREVNLSWKQSRVSYSAETNGNILVKAAKAVKAALWRASFLFYKLSFFVSNKCVEIHILFSDNKTWTKNTMSIIRGDFCISLEQYTNLKITSKEQLLSTIRFRTRSSLQRGQCQWSSSTAIGQFRIKQILGVSPKYPRLCVN